MTNRRSTIKALTAGLLAAAALTLGALALQAQPAPAPELAPTATPAPALSADLEGERWWTTTDCPEGVAIPCLDPTVEGAAGLPADVAGQVERLVDAQWVCIEQVGQPMPDGTVRLTGEQVQQCRQYAYAVAQPTA